MSSKRPSSHQHYQEEESDDSEITDTLDAYIEASEMYLEALKLQDDPGASSAYLVGMTAVYFGKAHVAFAATDNLDAIKGSLKEAMNAYHTAATFCKSNNIGKQFVYTSELIIESLRAELQGL